MSEYKYVMFQDDFGREWSVIFPSHLVHADVSDAIRHTVRNSEVQVKAAKWSNPKPVSAGICQVVSCSASGESETLSLDARPEDCRRINVNSYSGAPGPWDAKIEDLIVHKSIEHLEMMFPRAKAP